MLLTNLYQSGLERLKVGKTTVSLDDAIFENVQEGLSLLANAFENESNIQSPLETILTASFVACGPGNYLREKGLIKF